MDRQSVVEYIPALRRYARALTGDAWAADDLVQDTLERACSRWRLWLAGTDLRAWLFTVMHNVYVSQVRSNQRRAAILQTDALDETAQALPGTVSSVALHIDLQRCLLCLPDEQRSVLLLATLESMSYAEIAQVLGIPRGTVMSRLSRARERMRELMDGQRTETARPAPPLRRLK